MTIKKTLGMAVLATGLFGTGMTAQHVLSKVTEEPVSLTAEQEPVVVKKGYLDGQRTHKETIVTKDDKKDDTIKAESLEDINLVVSAKPKGVRKELVKQELGHKQTTRQVILAEVDEWVQQETQSAKRIAKAQYNQQLGQETTFVREPLKTVVNNSDFVNYDESTNNQESDSNSINDETPNIVAGDTGSFDTRGEDYTTGIDNQSNDTLDSIESEINESEINESEINESEINESEINESEVIEPEIIESEVIESEVIEPEINESEVIEPVIEEPVVEEPVIEEPVVEEPVVEEPVIEEPVVEEPVVEEPVIEEPVIEEPVIEEPVVEESVIEEPVIEEPVVEEPEINESEVIEPEYEEPEYEEPEYEEPVNSGRPVYPGNLFATAESMIGIPYVWGGRTPEQGFDCSGFVQYVFMETYGMQVGWWTGEQQYAGQLISVEEAQPGDLYFWGTYGGDTTHVAIATGGGSYIHAPQPGSSVGYGSIEWFTPQFAIRVL